MEGVGTSSAVAVNQEALPEWTRVAEVKSSTTHFFLSDDLIFTANCAKGLISLLDARTGDKVREFQVYNERGSLSATILAPNKRDLLVTHIREDQPLSNLYLKAAIWDVTTGTKVHDLPSTLNGDTWCFFPNIVSAMCSTCKKIGKLYLTFSSDSSKILSLCRDCSTLTSYNKTSLKKISSWTLCEKVGPWEGDLLPFPYLTQKMAITGLYDNCLVIFDTETGEQEIVDTCFPLTDGKIAFDSSGTHLAFVSKSWMQYFDLQSKEAFLVSLPEEPKKTKTLKNIHFFNGDLFIVETSCVSERMHQIYASRVRVQDIPQRSPSCLEKKTVAFLTLTQGVADVLFSPDHRKILIPEPVLCYVPASLWVASQDDPWSPLLED